jgi:hypothetical protein
MIEISVDSAFMRQAKVKWANFTSSKLGDDVYYLYEFVMIGINMIGEDKIVEYLIQDDSSNKTRINKIGNDWYKSNGFMKKLNRMSNLIRKTKATYDLIRDKTFEKKKEEIKNWKAFVSNASKMALFDLELYAVAVWICQNTTFKNQYLNSEDLKLLETKGSRMEGIGGKPRPFSSPMGDYDRSM